jgi:hypothetical protein
MRLSLRLGDGRVLTLGAELLLTHMAIESTQGLPPTPHE